MGTKRILLCLVCALVLVAWVAPPTQAGVPRPGQILKSLAADPAFPAEWAGIWNIATTEYECGGSTPTDSYADLDTICAGEIFTESTDVDYVCDGTIDANSIDVSCTASITEGPCTITFSSSVTGSRSGDSVSGTNTYSVTYSGCGPIPDECVDEVFTGTRIGGEPSSCASVPVVPTTWGLVKSRYGSE